MTTRLRWYLIVLLSFSGVSRVVVVVADDDPWWNALRRRLEKSFQRRDGQEPKPMIYDDFLTAQEAEALLARYEPLLRKSMHYGASGAKQSRYRTSRTVRLPPMGDSLVFEIEQRAAALAGLNHSRVEDFQLACYGVDNLYGLHRDDDEGPNRADRSSTVLIYLQAPEKGGSTLFTRRPLEKEKDMDTKQPLRTEAAALKLFRSYCDRPRRNFVVVEPKQGRAVTWPNWYGPNLTEFAKSSTHGACPIIEGRKCVIQQWITKAEPLPLRDERVAAIFTAGADISFRRHLAIIDQDERCLADASTQRGEYITHLCPTDGTRFTVLDEGPYADVGGMKVTGSMTANLPIVFFEDDGFSLSFWARNVTTGTKLISLGNMLSVDFRSLDNDARSVVEVIRGEESSVFECQISESEWVWLSLTVAGRSLATDFSVFSDRGEVLGKASIAPLDENSCLQELESIELNLFTPLQDEATTEPSGERTAFVPSQQQQQDSDDTIAFVPRSSGTGPSNSLDVSFILFHKSTLDLDEASVLRLQARRYNVNT